MDVVVECVVRVVMRSGPVRLEVAVRGIGHLAALELGS